MIKFWQLKSFDDCALPNGVRCLLQKVIKRSLLLKKKCVFHFNSSILSSPTEDLNPYWSNSVVILSFLPNLILLLLMFRPEKELNVSNEVALFVYCLSLNSTPFL